MGGGVINNDNETFIIMGGAKNESELLYFEEEEARLKAKYGAERAVQIQVTQNACKKNPRIYALLSKYYHLLKQSTSIMVVNDVEFLIHWTDSIVYVSVESDFEPMMWKEIYDQIIN